MKKKLKTHSIQKKGILVSIHVASLCPPTQTVNDSKAQEVLERDPQTQIMTLDTSNRVQNQSSSQALMASISARRYFIENTDLSSDMNPDSAVIEDALVQMDQALNRVNDEGPSVTHSNNKKYFDETSVYEESYTQTSTR